MPTSVIGVKAIVVGASSGIGREITRQIADGGGLVVAVARRGDRLEELAALYPGRIFPMVQDVTDHDSIPSTFIEATDKLTGLNLFVYASGVMPEVGPQEFNIEKDQQMIDVNISGAVAWINQAALRMQGTKHGSIVAIGSVAGERGRWEQPVYNASKTFLHAYMEAVRNRVSRYGVHVVTIKPGPVQTEMTERLKLKNAMSAEAAAEKILALRNRTGEHYLKFTHLIAFAIIRNIPSFLFRRLKI
ncbi:MAG: SDR family NAD(P)-dependent oxidoreductase [Fimbriimonadaceae bacterium]|nr:SDR family NAD(P)-dependent oxidoreductase [Fimbriimonadaceae bacterium]